MLYSVLYVLKNILETARQNQEQRTLTKLNFSNTQEKDCRLCVSSVGLINGSRIFLKLGFYTPFLYTVWSNPLVNYTDWFAMHLYVSDFCSVWLTVQSFHALMVKNKCNFFEHSSMPTKGTFISKCIIYRNVTVSCELHQRADLH